MKQVNRIAEGRLIDRDVPITFTFNGRTLQGFRGDTLASALLANGVKIVGRSFKYGRPRGRRAQRDTPSGCHAEHPGAKCSSNRTSALRGSGLSNDEWLAQPRVGCDGDGWQARRKNDAPRVLLQNDDVFTASLACS